MTLPVQPVSVTPSPEPAPSRLRGTKRENVLFRRICAAATWSSILILAVLLLAVTKNAIGWLDWQFLTEFDSRFPKKAGIIAGIFGTLWVIGLTILFAVPVGVGAAIYLEEYASDTWVTRLIRLNLANLAGVPSIVYGILGLTVFARMFGIFSPHGLVERWTGWTAEGLFWSDYYQDYLIHLPFGRVVISGALTLSLLILPVIIISAQEALRAIPPSLRHASLALGATKWQTVSLQVAPAALPGMMTGIILAVSRAIGETAPLVMLGAMTFVSFTPGNVERLSDLAQHPEGLLKAPFDTFTVIPIQIFNWVRQPKPEFRHVAAAGIVVLLGVLLLLNGLALVIRSRSRRHGRW